MLRPQSVPASPHTAAGTEGLLGGCTHPVQTRFWLGAPQVSLPATARGQLRCCSSAIPGANNTAARASPRQPRHAPATSRDKATPSPPPGPHPLPGCGGCRGVPPPRPPRRRAGRRQGAGRQEPFGSRKLPGRKTSLRAGGGADRAGEARCGGDGGRPPPARPRPPRCPAVPLTRGQPSGRAAQGKAAAGLHINHRASPPRGLLRAEAGSWPGGWGRAGGGHGGGTSGGSRSGERLEDG